MWLYVIKNINYVLTFEQLIYAICNNLYFELLMLKI